jgi:hypothetical protein
MIRCWLNHYRCRSIEISIHDDAAAFVRTTAHEQDVHIHDVVRKALAAYRYLLRIENSDGTFIVQRADGSLEKPQFP